MINLNSNSVRYCIIRICDNWRKFARCGISRSGCALLAIVGFDRIVIRAKFVRTKFVRSRVLFAMQFSSLSRFGFRWNTTWARANFDSRRVSPCIVMLVLCNVLGHSPLSSGAPLTWSGLVQKRKIVPMMIQLQLNPRTLILV